MDRNKVNWAELRNVEAFKQLVGLLEGHLQYMRNLYEDEPASEFNRGKVSCLKEILQLVSNRK